MQVKSISRIAIAVALLIVVSVVVPPIPLFLLPVPVTLQTAMVLLIGLLLSPNEAGFAVLLYLILGTLGLPVFAGGTGGIAIVLGPTGGFLLAMPIAALTAAIMQRFWNTDNKFYKAAIAGIVATIIIHVLGIAVWTISLDVSLWSVIASDAVFLPGDILKLVIVLLIWSRLSRLSLFKYN